MEHSKQEKPLTRNSFHQILFTPEEAGIVQRATSLGRNILDKIFPDPDDIVSIHGKEIAMLNMENLFGSDGLVRTMELPDASYVKALGKIVEFYSLQAGLLPPSDDYAVRDAAAALTVELLIAADPIPDSPPDNIMDA